MDFTINLVNCIRWIDTFQKQPLTAAWIKSMDSTTPLCLSFPPPRSLLFERLERWLCSDSHQQLSLSPSSLSVQCLLPGQPWFWAELWDQMKRSHGTCGSIRCVFLFCTRDCNPEHTGLTHSLRHAATFILQNHVCVGVEVLQSQSATLTRATHFAVSLFSKSPIHKSSRCSLNQRQFTLL